MNKQKNPIILNTYVFKELIEQGYKQSDFFENSKKIGIDTIEVRNEYFADTKEMMQARKLAEKLDISLWYSVPELLFTDSKINEAELQRIFEEVELLGAKQVKFTAGNATTLTADTLQKLQKCFEKYTVDKITIENNQENYAYGDMILHIVTSLEKAGLAVSVTFDIGNFIYVNENPLVQFKKLTKYIDVIHLKDVITATKEIVLLDRGDVPWKDIIKKVEEQIPLVIEYPCGDNIETIFRIIKKEKEKILEMEMR